MNKIISAAVLATMFAAPANALSQGYQSNVMETCRRYRYTEDYTPGRIDAAGNYRNGYVTKRRVRVPCDSDHGEYQMAHYPHHVYHPQPQPQPQPQYYPQQQSAQPIVINNQQKECNGKLVRMGLGSLLGGAAGYYAVGGKKSSNTILGTVLGVGGGAILGRATC